MGQSKSSVRRETNNKNIPSTSYSVYSKVRLSTGDQHYDVKSLAPSIKDLKADYYPLVVSESRRTIAIRPLLLSGHENKTSSSMSDMPVALDANANKLPLSSRLLASDSTLTDNGKRKSKLIDENGCTFHNSPIRKPRPHGAKYVPEPPTTDIVAAPALLERSSSDEDHHLSFITKPTATTIFTLPTENTTTLTEPTTTAITRPTTEVSIISVAPAASKPQTATEKSSNECVVPRIQRWKPNNNEWFTPATPSTACTPCNMSAECVKSVTNTDFTAPTSIRREEINNNVEIEVYRVESSRGKPNKKAPAKRPNTNASKNSSNRRKETPKKKGGKCSDPTGGDRESDNGKGRDRKLGCCCPQNNYYNACAAPPSYLDYGGPDPCRSGGVGGRARGRSGNPYMDRLRNVDVIEELNYCTPGGGCGQQCDDDDCPYDCFLMCNECGEMEPVPKPEKKACSSNQGSPVKYTRRQRFNFQNGEGDPDSPPFPWTSTSCGCPCCKAGSRRSPK